MQAQLARGHSPLLAVRDVSVVFGGIIALNGVSFDMHQGQILGLIGPNGAGKSTLFNCLAGDLKPTVGAIRFEGRDVGRAEKGRARDRALIGGPLRRAAEHRDAAEERGRREQRDQPPRAGDAAQVERHHPFYRVARCASVRRRPS